MKFGKVDNPAEIDFTLPTDHPDTEVMLQSQPKGDKPDIFVGCAKWNKTDLKGFYPKGVKDELEYYATQFNSIELNATFYRIFPPEQVAKWHDKTTKSFKFFPKLPQIISQFRRLKNVDAMLEDYLASIAEFKEKFGMAFLQMPQNFGPKSFDDLENFLDDWPKEVPLALELRHTDWYQDNEVAQRLFYAMESNNISHVITDTAGRRDLMHMRLTSPYAFIRFTGANHPSDYTRLDDWIERIKIWIDQGIKGVYFFVHQNLEVESPLLSAYFIDKLNKELGYDLQIPQTLSQSKLF
jgi:uncharacterized protein YecE (DUF72 family)